MKTTSHLASVLFPVLLLAGCYSTSSVKNGGLQCSASATCPDGFSCLSGHCWRSGTGPSATCTGPLAPLAGCSTDPDPSSAATATCDPVCQTGCDCTHRCVLADSASTFDCEAKTAPTSFIEPNGDCSTNSNGCAPGSVCLPGDATCPGSICYKTCRADQDCPKLTRCSQTAILNTNSDAIHGVQLCSPPVESCNPTGNAACATPKSGFACVFLAGLTGVGNTADTVCDCAGLHTQAVGIACEVNTALDDCAPGAVCVNGVCRKVCTQSGGGSGCSNNTTCRPIYGSTKYGYCG